VIKKSLPTKISSSREMTRLYLLANEEIEIPKKDNPYTYQFLVFDFRFEYPPNQDDENESFVSKIPVLLHQYDQY